MREKDMVLDVLSGTKASLGTYAKAITECCNQNVRQTFQKMRDNDEQFQYNLYKVAEQKGYYTPSPNVSPTDVTNIKTKLQQH